MRLSEAAGLFKMTAMEIKDILESHGSKNIYDNSYILSNEETEILNNRFSFLSTGKTPKKEDQCPALHIKVHEDQIGKYEDHNNELSWDDLCIFLDNPVDYTIWKKHGKYNNQDDYVIQVIINEKNYILLFCSQNTSLHPWFYCFALNCNGNLPEQRSEGIRKRSKIRLTGSGRISVPEEDAPLFREILAEMSGKPVLEVPKSAEAQLEIWEKYVQAMAKVIAEKNFFLKVKRKSQFTDKKGRPLLRYEIDRDGYVHDFVKDIPSGNHSRQKHKLIKNDDKVYQLSLSIRDNDINPVIEWIGENAGNYFVKFDLSSVQKSCVLQFEVTGYQQLRDIVAKELFDRVLTGKISSLKGVEIADNIVRINRNDLQDFFACVKELKEQMIVDPEFSFEFRFQGQHELSEKQFEMVKGRFRGRNDLAIKEGMIVFRTKNPQEVDKVKTELTGALTEFKVTLSHEMTIRYALRLKESFYREYALAIAKSLIESSGSGVFGGLKINYIDSETIRFAQAEKKNVDHKNLESLIQKILSPVLNESIKFTLSPFSYDMGFVFDEKAFRSFYDEKVSIARRSPFKLLTEEDKLDLQEETRNQARSFKGGFKLGTPVYFDVNVADFNTEEFESFDEEIPEGYLMPLFMGDLAIQNRMEQVIKKVRYPRYGFEPVNERVRYFIFDSGMARVGDESENGHDLTRNIRAQLIEKEINDPQIDAIRKSLISQDLFLMQGPPGTGKTTVIAEMVWYILCNNPGARILIASQAHLAVDNVLERLYTKEIVCPLRIAANLRNIEDEGMKYTASRFEEWMKAENGSKRETSNKDNAVANWIEKLITTDYKGSEQFRSVNEKWKIRLNKLNTQEKELFVRTYYKNVNVVAATCTEMGKRDIIKEFSAGFDYVIVDEASKVTPPELLMPVVLGKKVFIIGDHKQLPPMIEEKELAEALEDIGESELALEVQTSYFKDSQFERLFLNASDQIKTTLTTQYRMHSDIMAVINQFYIEEGGLKCGISHTMNHTDVKTRGSRTHNLIIPPVIPHKDIHVVWIDTNAPEIRYGTTFYNEREVAVIERVLKLFSENITYQDYVSKMDKPEDKEIGIISFYGKQVELLYDLHSRYKNIIKTRIKTVDKFQGMERNIIIVSTVRSNRIMDTKSKQTRENKTLGFAKDFRRINVAFSRARRLLIIVGNAEHFTRDQKYYNILNIIRRQGHYCTAEQILED